jgi:hypothetical protein
MWPETICPEDISPERQLPIMTLPITCMSLGTGMFTLAEIGNNSKYYQNTVLLTKPLNETLLLQLRAMAVLQSVRLVSNLPINIHYVQL